MKDMSKDPRTSVKTKVNDLVKFGINRIHSFEPWMERTAISQNKNISTFAVDTSPCLEK